MAETVAVVTGGGTGIGQATALRLSKGGWCVAVVGRREPPLKATVEQVNKSGGKALARCLDVRDDAQIESVIGDIVRSAGDIGVLVNNAGVPRFSALRDLDMAEFDLVMRTNLRGAVAMTRATLPSMIMAGGGSIINISSEVAARGNATATAYGASKAALNYLAKVWAVELAPYKIRANAVAPGITDTPEGIITQGGMKRGDYMRWMVQRVPLARAAQAEDIADAIAFLASDAARYITGTLLSVDGGISAT